jgi:hypothetical protein
MGQPQPREERQEEGEITKLLLCLQLLSAEGKDSTQKEIEDPLITFKDAFSYNYEKEKHQGERRPNLLLKISQS